jgi:hypothetical protein
MKRRPAVTLMEVLIAMFIMAIGMMALLALFPVGAASMAQALKDDRCAYASYVSENVAIVSNIRYGDAGVTGPLNLSPSGLVYVDPYAALQIPVNPALSTVGGLIPRVSPSFVTNPPPTIPPVLPAQLTDRWFSLQDDIGYNLSGYPDTSNTGGIVDRGRRYSFAYLLRQQRSISATAISLTNFPNFGVQMPVELYAVVYQGRPVGSLATTVTEWPLPLVAPVTPLAGVPTNSIQLQGVSLPGLKRGGWILDPYNGFFYRVTNIAEIGGTTTVELQQSLRGAAPNPVAIPNVIGMDYVAEVFDKGTGWQQ